MDMNGSSALTEAAAKRQRDWYLVQCKPKQDKRAEENLARQGYVCCRPVCRHERLVRGQPQLIEDSLFPGYLFIHMPAGASWAPLSSTRGVTKVVEFGGRPLAVGHELVSELQVRAGTEIVSFFNIGEKLTIVDGEFSGVDSIFMAMDGSERVLLLISLMSRQAQVSLPRANVRRN